MKIEILKKDFEGAIQGAARAVGKNLTLPLLSNILCKVEKNKLTVRATNLTIGVEYYLPIKTDEEFSVALPTQTLVQSVQALSSEKIFISYSQGNIIIEANKRKVLIKGVPSDEFPTIPKVVGVDQILPIKHFIDGLRSVAFSSAVSDIKPEIASVYIYPQGNNLVFVATDSFRLAEKKIIFKKIDTFSPLLIPTKNISEIIKIIENVSGDIRFLTSKNQIAFSTDKFYLTSRVVDGVYPDYQQIIPKEEKTSVTLLKSDLLDALRVSSIFSDKFGHMTLSVSVSTKKCIITTINEIGENKAEINAALQGDDIEVHLNIHYLLEALSVVGEDSIHFSFMNSNKPVILKPVGNTNFLYLIMPMNR
ncbi:MAG: DNA polymerase III subunit beta [Candidatus Pacebacteria bacterium]|nr:DNA polymerase III subunit beta [Candidatus Paceibacterota bacterium]